MVSLRVDNRSFIEFKGDHLLSKWGFSDGELLISILQKDGFPELETNNNFGIDFNSLVLCEIVECFVCTQIENGIQPYRCAISHNPIRVYEIDGQDMGEFSSVDLIFCPYSVSVRRDQIMSTAKALSRKTQIQGSKWRLELSNFFGFCDVYSPRARMGLSGDDRRGFPSIIKKNYSWGLIA